MNQRTLTTVGLTILGMYCLIKGINHISTSAWLFSSRDFLSFSLFSFPWKHLIPALFSFIVAGVLLRYANSIAFWFFGFEEPPEATIPTPLLLRDWLTVTLSIFGIILLIWDVVPSMLSQTFSLLFPLDWKEPDTKFAFLNTTKNMFEFQLSHYIITLLKIGVGLFLVLRARQVSDYLLTVQNLQKTKGS